jgi:hypothetical protein
MDKTFDRTDALITLAAFAVGFVIVGLATWRNRQTFEAWAARYRSGVGAIIDDESRQQMIAEEMSDGN